MNRTILFVLFFSGLIMKPNLNFGQTILGYWMTEKNESKIEIYKNEGAVFGKIVWAQDPSQKVQKNVGTIILKNFTRQSDGTYAGTIYAPHWGKTFKGKITVKNDNLIELRGYIGLSIFGSSQDWVRAKD